MRTIIIILVLLSGCPDPELHTDELVETDEGEAPTITMDEPIELEPGLVVLSGTAEDEQGTPAQMLVVELCSSLDGDLWEGNPSTSGSWIWQGTLNPGDHLITATARDSDGLEDIAEVELTVHPANTSPTCSILSPEDGASFETGSPVPFVGEADDVDDDELLLLWTSDIQGSIFMGESFSPILSDGTHLITLAVDDGRGGSCQDAITLTVGQPPG